MGLNGCSDFQNQMHVQNLKKISERDGQNKNTRQQPDEHILLIHLSNNVPNPTLVEFIYKINTSWQLS